MELNTILNICIAHNLTFDEFFLIYMTLLARDEENHSEYLGKWFSNGGKERLRELFNSLKNKGIILKSYNAESYVPNDIQFNKNFIKSWYKQSGEMGQELWNSYPNFVEVKGKLYSLKNISKKFYSLDDFYFYYSTAIGHSSEKHHEVMELLEWAKEKNLINFGILEFCASKKWLLFKEMRDKGIDNKIADSIYLD